MKEESPIVYVVDDDPSVRRSLARLIRSEGFRVETFAQAQDFLDQKEGTDPSCLILRSESTRLNYSHVRTSRMPSSA